MSSCTGTVPRPSRSSRMNVEGLKYCSISGPSSALQREAACTGEECAVRCTGRAALQGCRGATWQVAALHLCEAVVVDAWLVVEGGALLQQLPDLLQVPVQEAASTHALRQQQRRRYQPAACRVLAVQAAQPAASLQRPPGGRRLPPSWEGARERLRAAWQHLGSCSDVRPALRTCALILLASRSTSAATELGLGFVCGSTSIEVGDAVEGGYRTAGTVGRGGP
jgi:hypothetical protein